MGLSALVAWGRVALPWSWATCVVTLVSFVLVIDKHGHGHGPGRLTRLAVLVPCFYILNQRFSVRGPCFRDAVLADCLLLSPSAHSPSTAP